METLIHTASNLYNFIENARQAKNLDTQIAIQEEYLNYYEQALAVYDKIGCDVMAVSTLDKYNKTYRDLLALRLQRVKLEKEMLEFELECFTEEFNEEDKLNKINLKNFSKNNKIKNKTSYNIM